MLDRSKRAGLLLALAATAGCASATTGSHDLAGSGGDGGANDLSIGDLASADLAVADLAAPIDQAVIHDLQVVCNSDANERLCSGKCLTPTQCCTNTDCRSPQNGTGVCTNNACGISCNGGYKPCGARCIPNANCCVDGDCTNPGDPCKLAAGATCGANGVCNYLPVTCSYSGQTCNSMGNCVCPPSQHTCQQNLACIPDGTCCTTNDCMAVAGEVCPSPGKTCTCLSGFKACVNGGFSQCSLSTTCCSTADCPAAGQTCSGPGGTCSCPANQKVCGASCIPSGNCCVNTDCSAIVTGEICNSGVCQCPVNQRLCPSFNICIPSGTCCIDNDCPLAGQRCSGVGGSCACPAGQHQCASTGSCISNANCCLTSECSVSGQSCVGGPPGTCQCAGGRRVCTLTNTCIPNNTCCVTGDCVPNAGTHVTASSCNGNTGSGGACAVTGCNTGWFDINKVYSDGCECPDTAYGTQCTSATGLGTLGYGGSFTVSSRLPAFGTETMWLVVQFPNNNPNPSSTYHPQIYFTAGGGEYVFDVLSDCSGSLAYTCNTAGDQGTPQGLTSFSVQGTNGNFGANGGDCASNHSNGLNCSSPYNAVPPVGNNGQVYVAVHRSNTSSVTCNSFTLVIAD